MQKLTADEFKDRLKAFDRAFRIFGHMTDGDLNKAFQAYQEILSEKDRPAMLPMESFGAMTGSPMDKYERPLCPTCGYELQFRVPLPNDDGIKMQLVCSNVRCDTVINSDRDIKWWQENLKEGTSL